MMLLRALNWQGISGIAASVCLALLLLLEKGESRHWRKQSDRFEQQYRTEVGAHATTVANVRAAGAAATAADRANAERVIAEQRAINERTSNDFEARLAAARSDYDRLRRQSAAGAANPSGRGSTDLPRLPAAPGGPDESAGANRLPPADALIATEQAIQLDALIQWVKEQAKVEPDRR